MQLMLHKDASSRRKGYSFAFLGAGHIASALIESMLHQGYRSESIIATRRDQYKLEKYAKSCGIRTTTDNSEAIEQADLVFLCVRPHQLKPLLDEVVPYLDPHRHLVISVIAGLRLDTLISHVSCPAVRIMPNMASRVGAGITALLPSVDISDDSLNLVQDIVGSLGVVYPVTNDTQMDIYTALCGSGIAYIYYFLSVLEDSGVSLGLPAEQAATAAFRTMEGAIRLMQQEGKDPMTYLSEIEVPQGTTAAALDVLTAGSFEEALAGACSAACKRSAAIGDELAQSLNSRSSSSK